LTVPLRAMLVLAFLVAVASNLLSVDSSAGGTAGPKPLSASGSPYTWGDGSYGKLGLGLSVPPHGRSAPFPVDTTASIAQVAVGRYHMLALLTNGRVLAWGHNGQGELGTSAPVNEADNRVPAPVLLPDGSPLTGVKALAAGEFHSLALLRNGSIMAWGADFYGQLGTSADDDGAARPLLVEGITTAVGIAAGDDHSLAVLADGTARAWGSDAFGQLGTSFDYDDDAATPQPVVSSLGTTVTGVAQVAAGAEHSLARMQDGSVRAWGNDIAGELGDDASYGDVTDRRSTPVPVFRTSTAQLTGVAAVAAGEWNSMALMRDGTVRSWGEGLTVGDDADLDNEPRPRTVKDLANVVAVAAGRDHQMALKRDGSVWSWGDDSQGQLGTSGGFGDDSVLPDLVQYFDNTQFRGGVRIAAGGYSSAAIAATCEGAIATRLGSNDADTITATAQADVIVTGPGNDIVNGAGGSDAICTGPGNDRADGGQGGDHVDGGTGTDTATFPGTLGRTVNLETGAVSGEGAGQDLIAVENVVGSDGNDDITGDSRANRLEGFGGSDGVKGGSGIDTIGGGSGSGDVCNGGPGDDKFVGNSKAASGCETANSIP
jgi:alpha-tubulin suppressor-like RCC1 family protein